MPEAPELQVAKEALQRYLPGQTVEEVRVLKPTVLRSMVRGDFPGDIARRELVDVNRKGKSLILQLSGDRLMAVFPMLTGALQYCPPEERMSKTACFVLSLSSGNELRYLDGKQMGMAYYLSSDRISEVRRMDETGFDVLDEIPGYDDFVAALRKFRGEIKGVLTRGRVIAGVGNAYADEILFHAGIFPFRKVRSLKEDELERLYEAIRTVPEEAVDILRQRMGEQIHLKIRDFMRVHGKGKEPCPRCGGRITSITANQRITNYCRRCQPGMLIRN
jgi:formamidopyrimidine-DNA glycosylase